MGYGAAAEASAPPEADPPADPPTEPLADPLAEPVVRGAAGLASVPLPPELYEPGAEGLLSEPEL